MSLEKLLVDEIKTVPSQKDILMVLNNRSPKLFFEYKSLYNRLIAGEIGEQEVLRYFEVYGKDHWSYIQNYWVDVNGVAESDLIIFTEKSCYVIEVKNYTGKFEYKDGVTTIDGYEYSTDCIFQARRSFKNIRKILSREIHPDNIHGVLVFIGEHSEVTIHSEIDDIEILQRNQLMKFIRQISATDQNSNFSSLQMRHITNQLNKFQVANPFVIAPITADQMQFVKTGICCAQCANFDTQITRKFVLCPCGYTESRDKATLRTIEEYKILRYDARLRRGDLYRYMGKLNSKRYIYTILSANYTMVKNGKNTYYE